MNWKVAEFINQVEASEAIDQVSEIEDEATQLSMHVMEVEECCWCFST